MFQIGSSSSSDMLDAVISLLPTSIAEANSSSYATRRTQAVESAKRLRALFQNCSFTALGNTFTAVLPKKKGRQVLMAVSIGQKKYLISSDDYKKLINSGILNLPQDICVAMQNLDRKYQLMNLEDIILFCYLKLARNSNYTTSEDDYLSLYQDAQIVKDLIIHEITQDGCAATKNLLDKISELGYPELLPILESFYRHITSLLGRKTSQRLPDNLESAWGLPAAVFSLEHLQTTPEIRKVAIEESSSLSLCSLPSMIEDFDTFFNSDRMRNDLSSLVVSFKGLTERVLNIIDSRKLVPKLNAYIRQYPYDLRAVSLIIWVKENRGKDIDLNSNLFPEPVKALIRQLCPQPTIDDVVAHVLKTLHDQIEKDIHFSEAIFNVDLKGIVEVLSPSYAERLFKGGVTNQACELISGDVEEIKKTAEGAIQFCMKFYDALNASVNFAHLVTLFPVWLWGLGWEVQPEDYFTSFFQYTNEMKLRQRNMENLKKSIEYYFEGLLIDHPSLAAPVKTLRTDADRLTKRLGFLLRYIAGMQYHLLYFTAIISELKNTLMSEQDKIERLKRQQALRDESERRDRLAQQLIEESGKSSRSKRGKQPLRRGNT
ncbi:MAG: hypothetical protein ACHQUC_05810, partial [Chlamydiales bacterium]